MPPPEKKKRRRGNQIKTTIPSKSVSLVHRPIRRKSRGEKAGNDRLPKLPLLVKDEREIQSREKRKRGEVGKKENE